MSEPADPTSRLRHDLANPLGALLTETQMALFDRDTLPPETVATLERIEQLALRLRTILRQPTAS